MRVTLAECRMVFCPRLLGGKETCQGSSCMAWRWGPVPDNKCRIAPGRPTVQPERPSHIPASWVFVPFDQVEDIAAMWLEPDEEATDRRQGWCGLAGEAKYD
jgi:hypothetical protein